MDSDVVVPGLAELHDGEFGVRGLRLLEAQDIYSRRGRPLDHVIETRVDPVDIPGGDLHMSNSAITGVWSLGLSWSLGELSIQQSFRVPASGSETQIWSIRSPWFF